MTPEEYQAGKERLKALSTDPHANETEVDGLIKSLKDYAAKLPTKTAAPINLRETLPELGLQHRGGEPEPPSSTEAEASPLGKALAPALAAAREAGGTPLPTKQEKQTDTEYEDQLRAGRQATHDALYNDKARNASKLRALDVPPEYIPTGIGFDALPTFVGGKTVHYEEPSVEQFRRDMASQIDPSILEGMDEHSEPYKQYADAQWAKIYQQAKASGTPVVRHKYRQGEGVQKAADILASGIGPLQAATTGFSEGSTGGLAEAIGEKAGLLDKASMQGVAEAHPVARTVGKVLGVLNPYGLASQAIKGSSALFAGAAGKATPTGLQWLAGENLSATPGIAPKLAEELSGTALGRAAVSGAKGAIGAGADTGAQVAARKLSGEDVSPGDATAEILKSMAYGAPIGAAFDVLGGLAGKPGEALRKEHPEIAEASPLGETNAVRGFKPTKTYESLNKAAEASAEGTTPRSLVAGEMLNPMREAGAIAAGKEKAQAEQIIRNVYDAQKNEFRSHAPLVEDAMETHAHYIGPDGRPITGNERKVAALKQRINSMVSVDFVHEGNADNSLRAAQEQAPGSKLLTYDEAMKQGIPVPERYKEWANRQVQQRGESPAALLPPEQMNVIVKPHKYNPRQSDAVIEGLTRDLRLGDSAQENDADLKRMLPLAYQVRDTYPSTGLPKEYNATARGPEGEAIPLKGWSAFKHELSQGISQSKNDLYNAGLPAEPGFQFGPGERQRAFNAVDQFGRQGADAEVTNSIKRLAAQGGAASGTEAIHKLNQFDKAKALAEIRASTKIPGGERAFASSEALRMRLDPVLQTLASPMPSKAIPSGGGFRLRENRIPLGPEGSGLGDRLSELLQTTTREAVQEPEPLWRNREGNPFRLRGGRPGALGSLVGQPADQRTRTLSPAEAKALELLLTSQPRPF